MKKILVSLFAAAMMNICGFGAFEVNAEEIHDGSFQLEVEAPMAEATWSEMQVKPEEEVNADLVTVAERAVTVGGTTYIFAELKEDVTDRNVGALIFDEDGSKLGSYMYAGSDSNYWLVSFSCQELSESKKVTVVFYAMENDEYEYLAVKNATVTPKSWEGSATLSHIDVYNDPYYEYLSVYLPGDIDTSDAEVGLYDGNTMVAQMDITMRNSSSYIYVNSLFADRNGASNSIFISKNVNADVLSGNLYWSRKLQNNKVYSLRAKIDGVTFELGRVRAHSESVISALNSAVKSADGPVIEVTGHGYDIAKLKIEVFGESGEEAVATSEGGEMLRVTEEKAYYSLITEKGQAELDGYEMVVTAAGKKIFKGTFYEKMGITSAYYDHANNVVIAKTCGIPDGITINAKIGGTYSASGKVVSDKVILQFKKDGTAVKLPVGTYGITYTYTVNDDTKTATTYSMDVLGKAEETVKSISTLKNAYFMSGKDMTMEFVVSKNAVNDSGKYKFVYEHASGSDITVVPTSTEIVYKDTDCWCLKATLSKVDPGNGTLHVYKGEQKLGTCAVYVLDPNKVYGSIIAISYSTGERGVEIYLPYVDEDWDRKLFSVTVKDMLGNDCGITTAKTSSGNYETFIFENVAKDLIAVELEFFYDGKPIYDITKIESSIALNNVMNPQGNSYFVSATSLYDGFNRRLRVAFNPSKPTVAYVVEHGSMEVEKTWEFADSGRMYLTSEMLAGLNYNTAQTAYDIYFAAKDGSGYVSWSKCYFGLRREPVVVTDGIGMDALGVYWLYTNGEIHREYSGLYYWSERAQWVMIVEGMVDFSYRGLVFYDNKWWYVENGYVNFSYIGLQQLGNDWWYVANGTIDFTFSGLVARGNEWYYVSGGKVDFNYNGLAFVNEAWWYVVNGKIDFAFSGLSFVNNAWWYVQQGRIDFSYTGLVFFDDTWWYVENGSINFYYTGLAFVNECWWYVAEGRIDFNYSGLAFYDNQWWYVQGGMIDFVYVGLVFYNESWWYVEAGKINFDYSGLVCLNDEWWLVQGGVIDFGYNGLVFYNDAWWYVQQGKIDFSCTGLIFYDNSWWYVENGSINFSYIGLAFYNESWWYVESGKVNFDYSGTAVGPDGNTYNVVNGMVVF